MMSFSRLVLFGVVGYMVFVASVVWGMMPRPCQSAECVRPLFGEGQRLDVHVYTHPWDERTPSRTHWPGHGAKGLRALWTFPNISTSEEVSLTVPAKLANAVRRGTKGLRAHVLVARQGWDVAQFDGQPNSLMNCAHLSTMVTQRMVPMVRARVDLLKSSAGAGAGAKGAVVVGAAGAAGAAAAIVEKPPPAPPRTAPMAPMNHWIPRLKVQYVDDRTAFEVGGMPDLVSWSNWNHNGGIFYQPVIEAEDFSIRRREWLPLDTNVKRGPPPLKIVFGGVSLLRHRVQKTLVQSATLLQAAGFEDSDLDEIKELFSDRRLHIFLLTNVIGVVHGWLAYLAFKNDVGFFRSRTNYAGLSSRTMISNFVCSLIIFLFLLDSDYASRLVVGTVGVETAIELWKVVRVLSARSSGAATTVEEDQTETFDSIAMHALSLVMFPFMAGFALYTLIYYTHASWWSWLIGSLADFVYMVQFVLMTPQLFVNYKLKSVAHLPWRALSYKAFNTFIDDVFAWIIVMPTSHRIATLRDDLVFVILLYQRHIYKVDKTRANEYGRVYSADPDMDVIGSEAHDKEVGADAGESGGGQEGGGNEGDNEEEVATEAAAPRAAGSAGGEDDDSESKDVEASGEMGGQELRKRTVAASSSSQ